MGAKNTLIFQLSPPFAKVFVWKLKQRHKIGKKLTLKKICHWPWVKLPELSMTFLFCTEKCYKKSIWANLGWLAYTPICPNSPHCEAIFYVKGPLLIRVLCRKVLKNCLIGPLWAVWQTPYLPKRPTIWGLKYLCWHFFHKINPLSVWILLMKLFEIFKIGLFRGLGLIGDPHLSKIM